MSARVDVESVLTALKDESTYDFEVEITDLVTKHTETPQELEQALRKCLETGGDDKIRYAAFYGLSILLRRDRRYRELQNLTALHAPEFDDRKTLPHLRSLAVESDPNRADEALRCARVAKQQLPEHPGVLNRFATAVVDAEEQRSEHDDADIAEALQAINTAIAKRGREYAKHYATLARLHRLKGEYADAHKAIATAIEQEDRDVADYQSRVGEYQQVRLDIVFSERLAELRSQHQATTKRLLEMEDSAKDTIREIRTESAQFLGVLTAVIAFVVTGSQAALGASTFEEGGRVFLLVASAIVVILGTFGVVTYPGWARTVRSVAVIVLGIAGGFVAIRGWEWLT